MILQAHWKNTFPKKGFEYLKQAYNEYKEFHVKNMILKRDIDRYEIYREDIYESVLLVYHPLQVVQIYFRTATYDEIVNDVSVSLGDQISAIGGTMGLFAGFYFMLKFLFSLMSKTRKMI